MTKSLKDVWQAINMLRARVNAAPGTAIMTGSGAAAPSDSQIVIVSTGDAGNYPTWYNTDIATYPDTFGFANLQLTAPDGPNGVFNIGIRHDATNQSCFSTWLNGAGVIIEHAGAWQYVLDVSYNRTIVRGLTLDDGVIAPAADPDFVHIYVDSVTGDLMCKFGDGVVKTLATDS